MDEGRDRGEKIDREVSMCAKKRTTNKHDAKHDNQQLLHGKKQ